MICAEGKEEACAVGLLSMGTKGCEGEGEGSCGRGRSLFGGWVMEVEY